MALVSGLLEGESTFGDLENVSYSGLRLQRRGGRDKPVFPPSANVRRVDIDGSEHFAFSSTGGDGGGTGGGCEVNPPLCCCGYDLIGDLCALSVTGL